MQKGWTDTHGRQKSIEKEGSSSFGLSLAAQDEIRNDVEPPTIYSACPFFFRERSGPIAWVFPEGIPRLYEGLLGAFVIRAVGFLLCLAEPRSEIGRARIQIVN